MKCPRCKEEGMQLFITVYMYVDADDNGYINKSIIKKNSTTIWGSDAYQERHRCPCCKLTSTTYREQLLGKSKWIGWQDQEEE